MAVLDAVQAYFAAWAQRDAAAFGAVFAPEGTYSDPTAGTLPGAALGVYAQGLWQAFPDLRFELHGLTETTGGAAAEWTMYGTHQGPLNGMPPTGRQVTLPGADFFDVADGKVRAVRGYFDPKSFAEQLGMQAVTQPTAMGPVRFGTCVSMGSGRPGAPGAIAITRFKGAGSDDVDYVQQSSRQIMTDMMGMDGFIGFTGTIIETELMTVTAWSTPEAVDQIVQNSAHKQAAAQLNQANGGVEAWTSVWVPHRMQSLVARCPSCGHLMAHAEADTLCDACGAPMAARPYW